MTPEAQPASQSRGPVLVTGASGFVGAAVANVFRREGFPVRVLVRASSPRTNIDPADQVFIGDMRDRASVAGALKGTRYLVHVAADYRLWAPSPDDIIRANVEGTRIIMEEALRAGLERVVYTSSVATFDLRAGGIADETRKLPADAAIGAYKRSKVLAEDVVIDMVARERLPAVIVNPSTPIGPRDVRPTPTGRIIIEAASGRMPAFVETGLNFAHVEDVAVGHLAALHRGAIGERYILGGENVTLRQVLTDIAWIVGGRPPLMKLPRAVIYPIAYGAEFAARFTGKEPFATVDGLRMARYHMHFDDTKARRELGYTSRPYRDGLVEAIDWFAGAGYMKRPRELRNA
ncbi:hopanoid-associated sugar epimerase [Rhodoplanes sp. Z2-YC6860]|uniref:hopanoid-associated sugar epimerase n=1 Tax=Rhodoplanes sp. Z2-YC6860 TaxID=674703 RepID=UPI000829AF7A|nr:hopanoid-associated sugar epimerase [Rhodoplanes sp. Z2-YC6860]